MTGPEHYKAAETLIESARNLGVNALEMKASFAAQGVSFDAPRAIDMALAEAQVHATLALTAATAANIRRNSSVSEGGGDPYDWREAIGASRESRREAGSDA